MTAILHTICKALTLFRLVIIFKTKTSFVFCSSTKHALLAVNIKDTLLTRLSASLAVVRLQTMMHNYQQC